MTTFIIFSQQKTRGRVTGNQARLHAAEVEDFHVTSYQANFASRHTRDRHVGFHFTRGGIEKYNKISRYGFVLCSYHHTKLHTKTSNGQLD